MRHRLALVLSLTAWLLATGSHWDLVQTFGWGRMIASYSKTMSFAQAVRLTFTPENMCGVCSAVATAKQQSADDTAVPGGKLDGKVLLVCSPASALIFAAPPVAAWPPGERALPPAERAAPPVPPPRALV